MNVDVEIEKRMKTYNVPLNKRMEGQYITAKWRNIE